MNGEYLYEAMGGISPLHVHEAEAVRFSPPLWRRLLPLAACLAILIGMYAGFRSLMTGMPVPGADPAAAVEKAPLIPAAQAAASYLRSFSLFNWLGLLLGLTAWGLPCVALVRKQHKKALTLSSLIACALSLLLLICGVLEQFNHGDFVSLSNTIWFVMVAAVVLVTGTAALNLAVNVKWWLQRK